MKRKKKMKNKSQEMEKVNLQNAVDITVSKWKWEWKVGSIYNKKVFVAFSFNRLCSLMKQRVTICNFFILHKI